MEAGLVLVAKGNHSVIYATWSHFFFNPTAHLR